jgi:hypothetical protein
MGNTIRLVVLDVDCLDNKLVALYPRCFVRLRFVVCPDTDKRHVIIPGKFMVPV